MSYPPAVPPGDGGTVVVVGATVVVVVVLVLVVVVVDVVVVVVFGGFLAATGVAYTDIPTHPSTTPPSSSRPQPVQSLLIRPTPVRDGATLTAASTPALATRQSTP